MRKLTIVVLTALALVTGTVAGGWFAGGTAGADVMWRLPAGDAAAVRPHAGGAAGLLFAGGGSGADLGIELAPYVGGVAGVSVPLEDLSIFLEAKGNAAFGFFDISPW